MKADSRDVGADHQRLFGSLSEVYLKLLVRFFPCVENRSIGHENRDWIDVAWVLE